MIYSFIGEAEENHNQRNPWEGEPGRSIDKTDTDDEPDEMEEGDFFKLMVGWINEDELF